MASSSNSAEPTARAPYQVGRRGFLVGATAVSAASMMPAVSGAPKANAAPANGASAAAGNSTTNLNVGRGMADMTGEPLGAGMNGYAVMDQTTSGLRLRQMARAFIFGDDNDNRVVHVTADMGLMFQSIQMEVLRRLRALFGDLYHEGNVLIGASHTHVAPGGTSGHLMVDLTTLGFRPVTFEAAVVGIVKSIERAHADYQPSTIHLTKGIATDAGVNRSREAFERNPKEEQQLFPNGVNPESHTLHVSRGGRAVGLINWYGIHPTTFGPEHTIIDGDNKGYAAWKMEKDHGVVHREPADAPFVAAFAMSCPGDISPNMGLEPNSGPGNGDEAESARILGQRQIDATQGQAIALPGGGIATVHKWVNLGDVDIDGQFTPDGQPHRTGPAILGAAFAASSQEDGGGEPALGFNEGQRGGTPWVRQLNKVVLPKNIGEIQGEKECLLPVGYIDGLLQQTHMFSITRIGGFTLITNGLEPTTMSGYRMRQHVAEILGVPIDTVICQGYTNSYGHYVTTPEEYDQQDYEGGATAFGKYTLSAMISIYHDLADALADGLAVEPGSAAGDLTGIIPPSPAGGKIIDSAPMGKNFGDVLESTASVTVGQKAVAQFVAANPNNDLRLEDGYLLIKNDRGEIVSDDWDQATVIEFAKDGIYTTAKVTWETARVAPGKYDIIVRGSALGAGDSLNPFEGVASVELV
ncbi:neutral/alkaline non-lysosomal ceramidase N-terminal domain-containing protein [Corynebacterium amycolatum]|nr:MULTISPECIES: neutral/alkaline non-lysosomal ceramidase N-terminal domain-containing protein [Corynebacterium]MDK7109395.1 neutral/alkaline non-lysosomal ceramidase N-terminal domain-containing protein [Corynebacterium amycolatum]